MHAAVLLAHRCINYIILEITGQLNKLSNTFCLGRRWTGFTRDKHQRGLEGGEVVRPLPTQFSFAVAQRLGQCTREVSVSSP